MAIEGTAAENQALLYGVTVGIPEYLNQKRPAEKHFTGSVITCSNFGIVL